MTRIELGLLGALTVGAAGCTKANPAATCPTGVCSDSHFPYCDVDGVIGGTPGTCTPGQFATCDGAAALFCSGAGNSYDPLMCAAGCSVDEAGCHVPRIVPRYLGSICDTAATSTLRVSNTGTLDPDLDTNCNGGVIAQNGADAICVVHDATITIESTATFSVVSSYNRLTLAEVARSRLSPTPSSWLPAFST